MFKYFISPNDFGRAHIIGLSVVIVLLGPASVVVFADHELAVSDTAVLNSNSPGEGLTEWSPVVTGDGNGNWIAAWTECPTSGCLDWDLLFSRSSDYGKSWTAPQFLNSNAPEDDGSDFDAFIATDGNGVYVAVWKSSEPLDGMLGNDYDILFARSLDDGVTWSSPAALNSNAAIDSRDDLRPKIVTDGSGHWVAVWQSYDSLGETIGTDADILVAFSIDDAVSWSDASPLGDEAAGDSGTDSHPAISVNSHGRWAVAWRSNSNLGGTLDYDYDILIATSQDGIGWGTVHPVNSDAEIDSRSDGSPAIAGDERGNWIILWSVNDAETRVILAARSDDDGTTWQGVQTVSTDASNGGVGSPSIVSDGNGRWVAVWQSQGTVLGSTNLGPDLDILTAHSIDAGESWSPTEAFNSNAPGSSGDDSTPAIAVDKMGQWIAVWASSDALGAGGLVQDIHVAQFGFCSGIVVEKQTPTAIRFIPDLATASFDLVTGTLTELRADGDYSASQCLGSMVENSALDLLPDPQLGDGRYYLASGLSYCTEVGYGSSSLSPDPREELQSISPCP